MKAIAELKREADKATNAYFRALPGGRRGWKRPVNAKRIAALLVAMQEAQAAWHAAVLATKA